MSHYVVITLFAAKPKNLEAALAEKLAPFNENLEVPEYDKPCYCIGGDARLFACTAALKAVGAENFEEFRKAFHARADVMALAAENSVLWKSEDKADHEKMYANDKKCDDLWKVYVQPFSAAEKAALAAHPHKDKPKPECGECGGKGTRRSQYNPKSKWDWYAVGGHWNGYFAKKYKPEDDPENWEPCAICGGSGQRDDAVIRGKCNGCNGKGEQLKWALKSVPSNYTTVTAGTFVADEDIPFAFLTPDGQWCEKGEMGWFARVSDEKEDWKEQARAELAKHVGCFAVAVDCHI